MRVGVLSSLLCALPCVTFASRARADEPIFWDGRDAYTLFDRHPVNRQILDQRAADTQRSIAASDRFAALADLSIGTQQVWTGGTQSAFHGYFLADTYLAARLVPGLDANLNLLALQPSASNGYRVESLVIPGLALHAHQPLPKIAGDPVRIDVLGTDLGWVTIGNGLMIEQTPLEGVMAGASWRDAQARYMFAGRGYWDGDDVEAYSLAMFGGAAQLNVVHFQQGASGAVWSSPPLGAWYPAASISQPLGGGLRVAVEGAVKATSTRPGASMLRIDYMRRGSAVALHSGYQLRFYGEGFGPHDDLVPPTWVFATPQQQDTYVTNPVEYYYLTHDLDVWSHTLMLELRVRFAGRFELMGDAEEWLRIASSQHVYGLTDPRDGFHGPGKKLELYYRAGLRYFPWEGRRHRASFFVTNKQINAGAYAFTPIEVRFWPDTPYWVITLEAFL